MARRKRGPPGPGVSPEAWGTVYPLLDLHGLTGGEAVRRADAWLRARQAEGERTVVVVTGRGNRSAGLPVLRGEIEHLLSGLQGTVVARFAATDGQGGFRVELRRPPASAAPRPERADAGGLDPELRARAEEALWELGVVPTPALLKAEVERIRREEGGRDPTGEV